LKVEKSNKHTFTCYKGTAIIFLKGALYKRVLVEAKKFIYNNLYQIMNYRLLAFNQPKH